jgi:glycosyltransferase involved in cell wall biosynthesis
MRDSGTKSVLFFIESLGAGGAERQLLYLLASLDRTCYQPRVLTLYGDSVVAPHHAAALENLHIPRECLRIGLQGHEKLLGLVGYVRFMWRYRPALVQAWLHSANLIARLARPISPRHILVTSERALYSPRGLRSEKLTCWLDDALTVNSPRVRQQVEQHTRRPPSKLVLIPNAVPVENFAINGDPTLRSRLFPQASFVIGLIGRISREKDHATLLRALQLTRAAWLRHLTVFFLGEVTEMRTLRNIEALIRDYDLQDVVQLCPAVSDVGPYYHAADVIILPSLFESFSNVILEAFAAGKPVITSTDADSVGIVEPGITGWRFPTQDADALARCLQECRQLPPERLQEMGRQAQESVASYSIEAMTGAYLNLYDRLFESRRSKD